MPAQARRSARRRRPAMLRRRPKQWRIPRARPEERLPRLALTGKAAHLAGHRALKSRQNPSSSVNAPPNPPTRCEMRTAIVAELVVVRWRQAVSGRQRAVCCSPSNASAGITTPRAVTFRDGPRCCAFRCGRRLGWLGLVRRRWCALGGRRCCGLGCPRWGALDSRRRRRPLRHGALYGGGNRTN
jgi:hypothetical protein